MVPSLRSLSKGEERRGAAGHARRIRRRFPGATGTPFITCRSAAAKPHVSEAVAQFPCRGLGEASKSSPAGLPGLAQTEAGETDPLLVRGGRPGGAPPPDPNHACVPPPPPHPPTPLSPPPPPRPPAPRA